MAFVLNKTSKIAFYGAGIRGKQIYDYLTVKGFEITYIIDKSPDKVSWGKQCSVIKLEEVKQKIAKDTIIIVCLQNGLLHDEIALYFFENGYSKILFLPTNGKYEKDVQMRECYQDLLENTWNECKYIPEYNEMRIDKESQKLIRDDGDMVTCWISMEYLFSENLNAKEHEIWFNKHISCLTPYISLYEYIGGAEDYPKDYLVCFRGEDQGAQERLLIDRIQLWNMYEEKINTEASYFTSAPICANWKQSHFSIIDGHHRAAYLFVKGWYEAPVRMKKEDYKEYLLYKQNQLWDDLEREMKVALFKAGLELKRWMCSTNRYYTKVVESEIFKGYISHWIEIVLGGVDVQMNIEAKQEPIVVCLESEMLKRNYRKIYTLYEGFICNKRDCIGVYVEE